MKDCLHSHPRVQATSIAVKLSSSLKRSDVLYYYRFVVLIHLVFYSGNILCTLESHMELS